MEKEEWREIKSEIKEALSLYGCHVKYHQGSDYSFSYFEVRLDMPFEEAEIEEDLAYVIDSYVLTLDWDSEEDFNLLAEWDS